MFNSGDGYITAMIRKIRQACEPMAKWTDQQLRQESLSVKYFASTGQKLDSYLPVGFALVVEAARRVHGMVHHDVQLHAGLRLAAGNIVEMKTGEGKTLTATLPSFVQGVTKRGVHVVSVNDYLTKRDFEFCRPVLSLLGLSLGVITESSTPEDRKIAYRRDVTYGTAKEFGFDFLRDRLADNRGGYSNEPVPGGVQRELNFALVDEADSILLDEARTPLIIGILDDEQEKIRQGCYRWAAEMAPKFQQGVHYRYEREKRKVQLTLEGVFLARTLPQSPETKLQNVKKLYHYIQNAIKVNLEFIRDRNYAVVDEKVLIVDEFTGRPAEGRQWQGGIHQAVEAREGIEITAANQSAARVTIQNFFHLYQQFAGMTGTAWTARKEFKRIYKKTSYRIPTFRPVDRQEESLRVFGNHQAKIDAVVEEVLEKIKQNRSVLIGTRSVDRSEELSTLLKEKKIDHQVLNASYLEQEADIISGAGKPRQVTIATNMAGRGTDIKLDQIVKQNGGLHVILTEIHESSRIDWQLIGRCSRQGDPGSFRLFVSMEDEILLAGLGKTVHNKLKQKYATFQEISERHFRYFQKAQAKVEKKHLVDRMILMRVEKDHRKQILETGGDPYLAFAD